MLSRIRDRGAAAVGVPSERLWVLWHEVDRAHVCRPDWSIDHDAGPIVRVFCRRSHPRPRVDALLRSLRQSLSLELSCPERSVFVQAVRVDDEDVINVE